MLISGALADHLPFVHRALQSRFASSTMPGSSTAVRLIANSLADKSWSGYGSHWRKFELFCAEADLDPMTCTEFDIACYIGWIGDGGQIMAKTMQPYLSAINKVYSLVYADEDRRVAVGPLVTSVKRGTVLALGKKWNFAQLQNQFVATLDFDVLVQSDFVIRCHVGFWAYEVSLVLVQAEEFFFPEFQRSKTCKPPCLSSLDS